MKYVGKKWEEQIAASVQVRGGEWKRVMEGQSWMHFTKQTRPDWKQFVKMMMMMMMMMMIAYLRLLPYKAILTNFTLSQMLGHYSILYPLQSEYKYARKLRCSPLYSVLETRGAVFGTRMGYERPLYFDSTYKPGNPLPQMPPGSFYKPRFFDFMLEEYLACREGVGIIDMSSFSKMQIKSSGTEVVDYLQKLCSNDVNIPVGGCAHTGMQNERGGYENDCMLVRLTNNSYFMVSPTSQQTRIFEWMHQNLPSDSTVDITDMTSMYTVINVVGPKSRELMAELSNSDINLHPFTYKKVNVGYASDVMVMSFTHTGEPGYCLYIPSEYALHVYDRLMMVQHITHFV
uniref:GCVT N-terminal domain-containing protein n=1 Tax=Timema monikensis TaxID=170555 RepID=A0A7R9EBN0_9NEOP|nr:unnamed protein product [Timema monikensis]